MSAQNDPDPFEEFAAEATAFESWARHGSEEGESAVRAALVRITRLYWIALNLPDEGDDPPEEESGSDRVSYEEWHEVMKRSSRLPLDYYGVVFDPSILPPEEPVIGSLSDDVADIYRDVVSGLRQYQKGWKGEARWNWQFSFRSHWGAHATGAIRALHAWLEKNG